MAKLQKQSIRFTQVANQVLSDRNLSAKAKGIYAYLYSKPDNWQFAYNRIASEFSDGEKSILSGLKELEKCGYLERKKQGDGSIDYFLYIEPTAENRHLDTDPTAENGNLPFGQVAEIGSINNTDINTNTELYTNTNISSNEEILCDEQKNSSFIDFGENSEFGEIPKTELLENEEAIKSSAEKSTKPKLGQALEAEKFVRKTSSVSTKTEELNIAKAELKKSLLQAVGCDAFKDYAEWTELGRFLKLIEKIGKDEFIFRLEQVLEDPFKAKNSNKLAYLRKEIECYIHSPIIPKTSKYSVGQA